MSEDQRTAGGDSSFELHRLMILHRLTKTEEAIETIRKENDAKDGVIADLRAQVAVMTAKAAVWGGASGLGPVLLYILARALGLTPE